MKIMGEILTKNEFLLGVLDKQGGGIMFSRHFSDLKDCLTRMKEDDVVARLSGQNRLTNGRGEYSGTILRSGTVRCGLFFVEGALLFLGDYRLSMNWREVEAGGLLFINLYIAIG